MSDRGPRVALTFDAEHPDRPGSDPGNTDRILDALAGAGVRATFFVQGRWALANPETARRIADDGHLVGHHSHFHARMPLLSDEGIGADVAEGEAAVRATTGADPRPWFRCPFGTGHDDARVLGALDAAGYRNVHWTMELEDWEPRRSGPTIARDALAGELDDAVILLHTWPTGSAEAVPVIVDGVRARRGSFVRIDQLPRKLLP